MIAAFTYATVATNTNLLPRYCVGRRHMYMYALADVGVVSRLLPAALMPAALFLLDAARSTARRLQEYR